MYYFTLNKIIAENSSKLEKAMSSRYRRLSYHQTEKTRLESVHIIIRYTEQGKNVDSCKKEVPSHIQRQTH
jgi:hypothetical protein